MVKVTSLLVEAESALGSSDRNEDMVRWYDKGMHLLNLVSSEKNEFKFN